MKESMGFQRQMVITENGVAIRIALHVLEHGNAATRANEQDAA